MNYFVTGATGFIGRHLVAELLKRDGTIYALVREGSRGKLDALAQRLDAPEGRIVPVAGDLSKPGLGIETSTSRSTTSSTSRPSTTSRPTRRPRSARTSRARST